MCGAVCLIVSVSGSQGSFGHKGTERFPMKKQSEKKSSRSSGKKNSSATTRSATNRKPKSSASPLVLTSLGLDLSFRGTGLVVVRGTPGEVPKVVRHRHLRTEGFPDNQELRHAVSGLRPSGTYRGDNDECVDYIRRAVRKSFRKVMPDIVVIEAYAYVPKSRSLHILHEVGGVVKNQLFRDEAVYVVRMPTEIKSFATDNHTASKQEMVVAAKKEWKGCTNSDMADAYFLAKFGIERYEDLIEAAEDAESESA